MNAGGFDLQPTLRGTLVTLRPLRSDDFEGLFAVASDPLIWEQHPNWNRYQRAVFEEYFRGGMESKGALLIQDARTGEVIGSSRFCNFSPENSEIEIGYTFLARRCWGHTYNHEMKQSMIDHAFRFVESVVFVIGDKNGRSRNAIERIGAKMERSYPSQDPFASKAGVISVLYRLRRGEFK